MIACSLPAVLGWPPVRRQEDGRGEQSDWPQGLVPGQTPLSRSGAMKLQTPPLNPLHVFCIAARCNSFTEAAQELSVTQAAVSRQISVLENYFGVKLFDRRQRTLTLTAEGRRLHREIAPAFEMIGWASAELLHTRVASTVTIQTYPTLAAKWLLPRLRMFLERNEAFVVNVRTAIRPTDFSTKDADILIRFGSAPPEECDGFPLLHDRVAPACTVALFDRHGRDTDLLISRARLIRSKYRASDWTDWARYAGVDIHQARVMTVDSSHLAHQAAVEGIGVGAAQLAFFENDLADGHLILPFGQIMERDLRYWCIWSKLRRKTPALRTITEWLRSQAEDRPSGKKQEMQPGT